MRRHSIIGFDSAWTDRVTAPGAISILRSTPAEVAFEPQLASFDQALELIHAECEGSDLCLVALDQPTIVPNITSMRPVDRVAASVISWVGGGVQPANRSKIGMFDDAAPIWRFKEKLRAIEDPEAARKSLSGLFLIEVFPALALLSLDDRFHTRLGGPRYNPARRKTFKAEHWHAVIDSVVRNARILKLEGPAAWCEAQRFHTPRKSDQDKLDSIICALVGWHWLTAPRESSIMIGDIENGYMIAPASKSVRLRLETAAKRYGVTIL